MTTGLLSSPNIPNIQSPEPDIGGLTVPYISPDALARDIKAEAVLHEIEPELAEKVEQLAPELTGSNDSGAYERALERERSFFSKIFVAVTEMAERTQGPVTLLCDLDETLVRTNIGLTAEEEIVRPAFDLVVRELGTTLSGGLEVGILTSRKFGDLDGDALKGLLTAPIENTEAADVLNPDFVISSGYSERFDPNVQMIMGADAGTKIAAAQHVLDPRAVEAVLSGRLGINFYSSKLILLDRLSMQYPERVFVVVDDLPYAGLLSDTGNVRGVCVKQEILDDTMHDHFNQPKAPAQMAEAVAMAA